MISLAHPVQQVRQKGGNMKALILILSILSLNVMAMDEGVSKPEQDSICLSKAFYKKKAEIDKLLGDNKIEKEDKKKNQER